MAPDRPVRISIGFDGGQVLSVRVKQSALDKLGKALGGDGWHELDVEDGSVRLDLDAVVYLRVESDEQRVGF